MTYRSAVRGGVNGYRKKVFGVVVEIQLRPKPDKLFTWPLYAVDQRSRHRCPVVVLVVTPSTATARWAAQPIELGDGTWRALIVGPEGVPVVTDVELAKRAAPGDALAPHPRPGPERVDRRRRRHRRDRRRRDPARKREDATLRLIESSLGRAARKTFEMLPQGQRVFSANFAKGEAKGFAEGEAKGKADAILLVLKTRGLSVSAEQRQRILNCTGAATLDNWLKKAVTVRSVGQLLADVRTTA